MMLLRSSSSPILNSWLPAAKEPSPLDHHTGGELFSQIPRGRSVAHLSPSISLPSNSSSSPSPRMMMTRALSESNLSDISGAPKAKPFLDHGLSSLSLEEEMVGGEEEEEEEEEEEQEAPNLISASLGRLLSNSGLNESLADGYCMVDAKYRGHADTLDLGDSWRICGGGGAAAAGGGGGGGGDDGFCSSDSNNSKDDAYYLKMIKANPGNSLVLGNYAKFLKEVRGDLDRAAEYCERAILANPGDADVLSLYGELIWQTSKDAQRAEGYFDRAVQAAPQDSYVMASYARFLWDAEDEEEEEEKVGVKERYASSPSVAAAS